MNHSATRLILLFGLATLIQHSAVADTLCNASTINKGVQNWATGEYLFNCLADKAKDPGPITLPPQPADYRVDILWGGFDKSNGTPHGDIQLLVGTDQPRHTQRKHKPETGDDDQTWRWNGRESLLIPANTARKFRVLHDTYNSHAGNTYLRIRFMASN